MNRILFFSLLLAACSTHKTPDIRCTGNEMLPVLGAKTSSKQFRDFRNAWQLDNNYENRPRGIQLFVNGISEQVEGIIIAGERSGVKNHVFSRCASLLPFGITIQDSLQALKNKLGEYENLEGRNALKFYRDSVAIEVSFSDTTEAKISYLKFSREIKPVPAPEVLEEEQPVPAEEDMPEIKSREPEESTPVVADTKSTENQPKGISTFKQSIMDVFNSSRESDFASIKNGFRTERNFWNYKYTYYTKLKVPGEKYNMLYSFPFITSSLDFVSVIKESPFYDKSFDRDYHKFEKLLLDNFPASEGWISSCLPNNGKSKLADIEVRNDRYGSVILDYTTSPKGAHVLYLRFLLYSN